jgi:pimeloyl-ACP methyl ester carboxylesterase
MSTQPTAVLVHGAWHDARCFDLVVAELERRGVRAIALDRPGHGASTEPLGDLAGDAASVRAAVGDIDGPVVLVGHSYGGAVITEAGAAPNVAHLIYLTAFVLDVGESVMHQEGVGDHAATELGGAIAFHDDGTATIDTAQAVGIFYGDCDAATAQAATAQLQPQSVATFAGTVTHAPWKDKPSTYVVCTDDHAIAPSMQRWLAQRCGTVIEIDASHSPFLSMPGRIADIIATAATSDGTGALS